MSQQTWNNDINKHVNWGGDSTTGNLPVSGEKVQKFIKDTLQGKAGDFYADTQNNRYLVFADAEDRNLYLSDPVTYATLLIGSFDAPANYTASISLTSDAYNAISISETGNYIDFTWDVVNKNNQSQTSETAVVTYTIVHGGTRTSVTEQLPYGTAGHFLVDPYLSEGTNNIIVNVIGQNTLAGTSISVTYVVVNLVLTDTFDISTIYNLVSNPTATAAIPYKISGTGTKQMQWYLDGELLDRVQNEDEVLDTVSERTKYISLANLSQGVHSIAYRAYVKIGDSNTYFFSDVKYREVLIYNNLDSSTFVAIKADLHSTYAPSNITGDITSTLALTDIEQYVPYTIPFAICSPSNSTVIVTPTVGTETYSGLASANGNENDFTFTCTTAGSKTITFTTADGYSRSISATVAASSMSISEITNDLVISFQADGRNNTSANKSTWSQGNYSATFDGFSWNSNSGWVDGELFINKDSSLNIDLAPLTSNTTSTGMTLEFEFSTLNVNDQDAVICDLRDSSVSPGLLITASEVTLVSSGGISSGRITKSVNAKFKSGENVRISFVINKATGTTNHGLAFVYINGILSGACDFAQSDSFASAKTLTFAGSANAEISIKQIRIYNRVLTSNEILNNYILYRTDTSEMSSIYNKNDIYEDGTTTISIDKIKNYLPVMLITGNVPYVDKQAAKSEITFVDIEYTNLQDPTRSFTAENIGMSPQGTSSMSYPKRNYRLYTAANKAPNLVFRDYQGNVVSDRKYSFKEGAQRVDRWCLKADFAESSSTHNTGIARLWNQVMTDAIVTFSGATDPSHNVTNQKVLRTAAQNAAFDSSVNIGDVRTTIDGFPIVCFYRLTSTDTPVFMGKYNFNNDKATESVYGFTDIPGFDNSNVECWECLDSEQDIALFKNTTNWNSLWDRSFEGRYPDGNTTTTNLKAFATWMSGVQNDASTFATQKWSHLDVYKVAAYYVYLMRFGAVDQTAKNAMLTTEDGLHWFFINYDNDTILGVRNDGLLKYGPEIDRTSMDEELNIYSYAGHDSTLWNRLEADTEFIAIVKAVDDALFKAGLSYEKTLEMFEEKQSNKWCERVYNQDAQYKYIDPYVNEGQNYLSSMQGSRKTHRRWWLARRFSLYDSMYVNSNYTGNQVYFLAPSAPQGTGFTLKAGYNMYYGYGIQSAPVETGIQLDKGDTHTFYVDRNLAIGTPVRIYSAYTIGELDLSNFCNYISVLNLTNAVSETEGSVMKKLVIGKSTGVNTGLSAISGLAGLKNLEYLDIQNMQSLSSIDTEMMYNLETLKAAGSGLTAVTFADSGNLTSAELPSSLASLTIKNNQSITFADLTIANNGYGLNHIDIQNCPALGSNSTWINNWVANKTSDNNTCYLRLDNIDWSSITYAQAAAIAQIVLDGGTVDFKGHIYINEALTQEQKTVLSSAFGNTCFDPDSVFYFTYIYQDITSVSLTKSKSSIGKNDSITITANYSGNNGVRYNWTISDTSNISVIKTNDSITINSDSNVSEVKSITVTYTITKSNGGTVSATTTFTCVPYEFFLNGVNFNTNPIITMIYGSGDSSVGYSEAIPITCSNTNISFSISSVTVTGGSATYSGTNITSITKTTLSNNVEYNCTVTLSVNSVSLEYVFKIKTILVGMTINNITDIVAALGSGGGSVTFSYPSTYASNLSVVSATVNSGDGTDTVSNLTINGCTIAVSGYNESTTKTLTLIYKVNNGANCTTTKNFNVNYVEMGATITATYRKESFSTNGDWYYISTIFSTTSNFSWPTSDSTFVEQTSCSVTIGGNTYNLTWGYNQYDGYHYRYAAYSGNVGTVVIMLRPGSYCSLYLYNTIYDKTTDVIVTITLNPGTTLNNFKYAWYQNTALKSCEIQGARYIGSNNVSTSGYTFENCNNLQSVTLGSSTSVVSAYTFANCSGLSQITCQSSIAPSVYYTTFQNIRINGTLIYPAGSDYSSWLSNSNYYLGLYDWNVPTVYIDNINYQLKDNNAIVTKVPAGETNYTGSITIPASITYQNITYPVTKIGINAFANSTITAISIPTSVTEIDTAAFANSTITALSIPNSVTKIGGDNINSMSKGLCYNCASLQSISFGSGITSIPLYCCDYCQNLTSVSFSDNLTTINNQAFDNCTSLTTIIIPSSIQYIKQYAFRSCEKINNITINKASAPEISTYAWGNSQGNCTGNNSGTTNILYVPQGATGYDTTDWTTILLSSNFSNFTLSATL